MICSTRLKTLTLQAPVLTRQFNAAITMLLQNYTVGAIYFCSDLELTSYQTLRNRYFHILHVKKNWKHLESPAA